MIWVSPHAKKAWGWLLFSMKPVLSHWIYVKPLIPDVWAEPSVKNEISKKWCKLMESVKFEIMFGKLVANATNIFRWKQIYQSQVLQQQYWDRFLINQARNVCKKRVWAAVLWPYLVPQSQISPSDGLSVWRYPKYERNRNFFPTPNFSDTESDTFLDTKIFRYRIRYVFLKPICFDTKSKTI